MCPGGFYTPLNIVSIARVGERIDMMWFYGDLQKRPWVIPLVGSHESVATVLGWPIIR